MFSFGDSKFLGSVPGAGWCPGPKALAFAQTPATGGYWMLMSDGQVVPFGDAGAGASRRRPTRRRSRSPPPSSTYPAQPG